MCTRFRNLCPLLIALFLLLLAEALPVQAQQLYSQGGRVIHFPAVHLVYYQDDWDVVNPEPEFKKASIDAWVDGFMQSDYFDKAGQYFDFSFDGVHRGYLADSFNSALGNPLSTTDPVSIQSWLAGEINLPFTGPPAFPGDDDVYVVMLPRNTGLLNNPDGKSYTAYHLFVPVGLPFPLGLPLFPPFRELSPYTLIPTQFALTEFTRPGKNPNDFFTPFDGLTFLYSHEMIEACTDPIDTFFGGFPALDGVITALLGLPAVPGWFDVSLPASDWFTKSEAADICEFAPYQPAVWHNGAVVSAYWSNEDHAPVCGPGLVRNLRLRQNGIPFFMRVPGTFDGRNLNINHTDGSSNSFLIQVVEGTTHSYSFPSIVSGGTGIRYITATPPGSVVATGPETVVDANYNLQYFVNVQTLPAAAAIGNASLTQSGWVNQGGFSLDTDQIVSAGAGNRYNFVSWQVQNASTGGVEPVFPNPQHPHVTLDLFHPINATAVYNLEHLLTVNTTGLGANLTHIVNGSTALGTASDASPLGVWILDGTALNLLADDVVSSPDGTQYLFGGFSPAPPATMSAPFATTAAYMNMQQVIGGGLASGGIYGPGANGIANSLSQEWASVEAAIARTDYVSAMNKIKAFINHVQAQTGKHITPDFSRTLQTDALRVDYTVIVKARDAGQIDAGRVDSEYTYYHDLLSSLGGSPRPHP